MNPKPLLIINHNVESVLLVYRNGGKQQMDLVGIGIGFNGNMLKKIYTGIYTGIVQKTQNIIQQEML